MTRCGREAESLKRHRDVSAELAAARSDAAGAVARLEAEKRDLEARVARHEEAAARDAEGVAARSARRRRACASGWTRRWTPPRRRGARTRSCASAWGDWRACGATRAPSRRADADVADAEDRADLATRRAEKAENGIRRRDEKAAAARDFVATPPRAIKAAMRRDLETVKRALTAANAKRDADAALARESADREAALARGCRGRRARGCRGRVRARRDDALTEAGRRSTLARGRARRLAGEVASARDELKQFAASAHVASRLEIELQQEASARASLELERARRCERVVVEAHVERSAVVAAAARHRRTRDAARRLEGEVAAEVPPPRLEGEAAGFRAARERAP